MSKLVIAAALAILVPAVAAAADRRGQASVSIGAFPALTNIYVASGVQDSGSGDNTGVATTIHCTNWTGATQQIRFTVKNFNSVTAANQTVNVGAGVTVTKSTHGSVITEDLPHLSPGVVISQGSIVIATTAAQVTCTVQVRDAASAVPASTLHLVRFNPWPGGQE